MGTEFCSHLFPCPTISINTCGSFPILFPVGRPDEIINVILSSRSTGQYRSVGHTKTAQTYICIYIKAVHRSEKRTTKKWKILYDPQKGFLCILQSLSFIAAIFQRLCSGNARYFEVSCMRLVFLL